MKALRLTLLALACSSPLVAAAQWQWLDDSGRKVFSDRAPPAGTPANRILRQPGQRPAEAAAQGQAQAPATPVAATPAKPPRPSGKDAALEEKVKQAEAAEAAKQKAEEQKLADIKNANCDRARAGKAGLNSGVRMARTNANGEREIMDDKARAAEMQLLDSVIARDCASTMAAQ